MATRLCTQSHFRLAGALLASAVLLAACNEELGQAGGETVETLRPEVVAEHPHNPEAFTQGLELADSILYESTGLVGRSWIEARDFATGEEIARQDLDLPYFGEGLTVTEDRVWQVTWRDGTAFERDPQTLEEISTVEYEGEGWGLCSYPDRIVMSDGTDTLTFRDPETFAVLGTVAVTLRGEALDQLNELDCAEEGVYANVFQTDWIVRISPDDGSVNAVIDASNLLSADERAGVDVLNGIAAIPDTDRFLLTGKLWPKMFEVRFVPAGE